VQPYYDQDGITIYHGDCREVLPQLEPIELIATDPPYNLGRQYGTGTDDNRSSADFAAWVREWMPEILRLGSTILLTPGIANLGLYLQYEPKWILAWHKPFGVSRTPIGFNNWEPVLMWGKWWRKHYGDYICAPLVLSDRALGGHSSPKPLSLMHTLIERNSEDGLVLDPFMGSGTTLRAAKDLGRRAIGIEIEERYCELAANRLAQGVLDLVW
jgi:site-specific DNA-methyltransferase (adenine-specific)